MSKMNFAFTEAKPAQPEIRPSLLTLGYFVLGGSILLMALRPFLGV